MAWGEEKRENILERGTKESQKPVVTRREKNNTEQQMHESEEYHS